MPLHPSGCTLCLLGSSLVLAAALLLLRALLRLRLAPGAGREEARSSCRRSCCLYMAPAWQGGSGSGRRALVDGAASWVAAGVLGIEVRKGCLPGDAGTALESAAREVKQMAATAVAAVAQGHSTHP